MHHTHIHTHTTAHSNNNMNTGSGIFTSERCSSSYPFLFISSLRQEVMWRIKHQLNIRTVRDFICTFTFIRIYYKNYHTNKKKLTSQHIAFLTAHVQICSGNIAAGLHTVSMETGRGAVKETSRSSETRCNSAPTFTLDTLQKYIASDSSLYRNVLV